MPNPNDVLGYVAPSVAGVQFVGDGVSKAIRGLRDGTISMAEFKLIMAMEGRIFAADVGSLATPVGGHAQANFNQLQPDLNLDVPAGTVIIPLPFNLYLETSAGTLNRVFCGSLNQLMGDGTSSALTAGPTNIRSDRKLASVVRGRQAYSGNGNALLVASTQIEHWRGGYPFVDATGSPMKAFQPMLDAWPFPVIVGPASWQVYYVGTTTAPTGWLQQHWIELPSQAIS